MPAALLRGESSLAARTFSHYRLRISGLVNELITLFNIMIINYLLALKLFNL